MRKFYTLLIIAFVSIATLCSCGGEAVDTTAVNNQTILVYLPWTGNANSTDTGLLSSLQANVDSIDAAIVSKKGLTNSRVLVFFSKSAEEATLCDLVYNAETNSVDHVLLNTYTGTSNVTVEGFANLLKEVQTKAYALNYALIIGSHGCGWTYRDDWENYPSRSAKGGENVNWFSFGPDPNNPITRFFGSVNSKSHMMDVSELAEAIKQSGINKMQFILFDACYMGNVETAYELKDVTNFMLASSSEILAKGVPYYSLWSSINSTSPSYSSIVSGFCNFYETTVALPYANFAAIDCRQMDKLAEVMKNINSQYKLSDTIDLDSIQHLDGYDLGRKQKLHMFYDLETYVDSLHPSDYLKSQFKLQLSNTVVSSQATAQVISAMTIPTTYIPIKHYSGLTISDPSINPVAIKGREKTGWWKATH